MLVNNHGFDFENTEIITNEKWQKVTKPLSQKIKVCVAVKMMLKMSFKKCTNCNILADIFGINFF